MRSAVIKTAFAFAVSALCAAPTGDRPDARHPWAVHDDHRPEAPQVDVPENGVPSDALVLFDGTAESVAKNWCNKKGEPSKWVAKDGLFVCTPGSGGAYTRERFGDCQLHVEFRIPDPPGPGLGNSGVILQDRYEVQVVDSFHSTPAKDPQEQAWSRGGYADGQAGAIYGQHPPLVQPCRAPGKWQSYDIIFHPPLEQGGKFVDTGTITVLMNGVVIQDAWPIEGRCKWLRRADVKDHAALAPLRLQDHGHPVAYRNIWIRRLPSRFADKLAGPGLDLAAVAAQRAANAAQALARAKTLKDPERRLMALGEAWGYEPTPATRGLLEEAAKESLAAYAKGVEPGPHVRLFAEMCEKNGIFPKDHPFVVFGLKRPVRFE